MEPSPSFSFQRRKRERGSILIVAVMFSAMIAISLGSYITLTTRSVKLANRTFYSNAAINLAETGIEEALWSFNQFNSGVALATAWSGWTITPTSGADGTAHRTFTNFGFAGNTTGTVKVYVDHYNPSGGASPKVLSLATISIPNSAPLIKEVEVVLSRRSYFAMGLVAKDTLRFNGNNAYVDSWNSAKLDNGTARGTPAAYASGIKHDKGSIGAGAVQTAITIQNADIFGTASVGASAGNALSAISVGPNGKLGSFSAGNGYKDPTRITGDFVPQLELPSTPAVSDAPLTSFSSTLGTAGATTLFRSTVGISNNLTINGHVTLVIDVPVGQNAISMTGNKVLLISANSSLIIYTPGNVANSGNGAINNNNAQPITFQLYGTSSTTQTISVGGNGVFKGAIYAPNAAITLHGNGDIQGSVVGNDINVSGNASFHYDESLSEAAGSTPYGPSSWREITTAAERASLAAVMNF